MVNYSKSFEYVGTLVVALCLHTQNNEFTSKHLLWEELSVEYNYLLDVREVHQLIEFFIIFSF